MWWWILCYEGWIGYEKILYRSSELVSNEQNHYHLFKLIITFQGILYIWMELLVKWIYVSYKRLECNDIVQVISTFIMNTFTIVPHNKDILLNNYIIRCQEWQSNERSKILNQYVNQYKDQYYMSGVKR